MVQTNQRSSSWLRHAPEDLYRPRFLNWGPSVRHEYHMGKCFEIVWPRPWSVSIESVSMGGLIFGKSRQGMLTCILVKSQRFRKNDWFFGGHLTAKLWCVSFRPFICSEHCFIGHWGITQNARLGEAELLGAQENECIACSVIFTVQKSVVSCLHEGGQCQGPWAAVSQLHSSLCLLN